MDTAHRNQTHDGRELGAPCCLMVFVVGVLGPWLRYRGFIASDSATLLRALDPYLVSISGVAVHVVSLVFNGFVAYRAFVRGLRIRSLVVLGALIFTKTALADIIVDNIAGLPLVTCGKLHGPASQFVMRLRAERLDQITRVRHVFTTPASFAESASAEWIAHVETNTCTPRLLVRALAAQCNGNAQDVSVAINGCLLRAHGGRPVHG